MRKERETLWSQDKELPIARAKINARPQILKFSKVYLNNLDKCITMKDTEIYFLKKRFQIHMIL